MAEKICPICPKGCSQDALSCGRGRAYFQESSQDSPNEAAQSSTHHHNHNTSQGFHHRRGRRGHRHVENPFPQDSVLSLLMQCGYHLFHAVRKGDVDAEELVKALSLEEQNQLKELLTKLNTSWKQ